jgi:ActR/RegA family two-component response regulator
MVLLQWARQNRPDLATIVMTGYATPDSAIEALREGAVDYLMKPLDRGTLHRRVDRVVEFRRFVNAPGVLGLYMDVLREVIETAADELTSETEQRLNQVRERLDRLFRTMRMMEQTLIEQRRQLAEIASCAEEGHDCCPPNETARPILAHIAALAARRL